MAQKCEHLTSEGSPCRAYAMRKQKLCFLHADTNRRADAVKKGGTLRGAQKAQEKLDRANAKLERKLAAVQTKREDGLPKVTALAEQHGLDAAVITSEHLEDVHRLAAYISSLLLQGKVSAPTGQALAAWARLSIQARELEVDIETNRLLRARGINV